MAEVPNNEADLQAAVAGDHDALARLLVQHGERLSRRITRRLELNPYADFCAEDVLQEAYVDAFQGIDAFDISQGTSFVAWLDRVADNRMVSMLRERKRKKRGGNARKVAGDAWRSSAAEIVASLEDHRHGRPCDGMSQEEVVTTIRAESAQLPPDQRYALESHYLDGRSLDATAEHLGKTEGAVRGLIHRAKQSMRLALGNSSRWFRKK